MSRKAGRSKDVVLLRWVRGHVLHPGMKSGRLLGEPDWSSADVERLIRLGLLEERKNFTGSGVHYLLSDAGRTASREGFEGHGLEREAARKMHDEDLKRIWRGHPVADAVLAGRDAAATILRVTLARVFGKPGMATQKAWHVVPCVTDVGTIGILILTNGTAWDTGVPAPEGCADLGLESEVYGAANSVAGDAFVDGELVQRDGSTPGRALTMPMGWSQIELPTWRGYTPGAGFYDEVPVSEYRPVDQIRPRLVASGLMTCYGYEGQHPAMAPDGGPALDETHGWDASYPWGVPSWVVGGSVTVLDTLIDAACPDISLRRTRVPRGTELQEQVVVDLLEEVGRRVTAEAFRSWAKTSQWPEEREAFLAVAGALDAGRSAAEICVEARPSIMRAGNATNWMGTHGASRALDALQQLEAGENAWEKALAIGRAPTLAQAIVIRLQSGSIAET